VSEVHIKAKNNKEYIMPIYMDRHDLNGVTVEEVEAAHQRDLNLQDDFKCKSIFFWHDVSKGAGFCLFEAPDKESIINLHNTAHVGSPAQIIKVELNEVEFFLGKLADLAWLEKRPDFNGIITETAHRTIMYLEIENPLILKLPINKNKFTDLLKLQKKFIKDSFLKFEGYVVSWEHNSILTSFASEENAIVCAADIQSKFIKLSEIENIKFSVSIGLNLGAPVANSDELFGDAIHLAKQLEYVAGENQIIISSSLGKAYNEFKFKTELKNSFIKVLSSRYEDFLIKLFETFEKSWNEEEFNIDSLVKQFGMSRAQLYRRITDLTGYSPNNFIREIRLKNALKLIEIQKGNISEIAYESGFNNPSYFSRCFHKKFGILPSEYASYIH
jgi:AraC-like DNA-binding protein